MYNFYARQLICGSYAMNGPIIGLICLQRLLSKSLEHLISPIHYLHNLWFLLTTRSLLQAIFKPLDGRTESKSKTTWYNLKNVQQYAWEHMAPPKTQSPSPSTTFPEYQQHPPTSQQK